MKKIFPFLRVMLTLFFLSSILSPISAQKRNTKKSFDIKGNEGIILRVDVEYALSRKGYLNNETEIQCIATNIGTVPYTWGKGGDKNQIVFEFTTTDGKVVEVAHPFYNNLQPGKTSQAFTLYADVGAKRYCTSVKVIRLDSIN